MANSIISKNDNIIHILHVDDDKSILEITNQILLDLNSNFEIDFAFSVDEALRKISSCSYDAVISDYEMPQKNGLQFLKELREQNNEIPFILFTGRGREEVAIKALNLGADGYFNKQGTPETVYGELAHGIRQSVERKKAKDALIISEENFRAYLESSPVSVFVANQEGKYEYVNEAASRLLSYSREELLNMTVQQIVPKEDTPKSRFAQLKEKGYFAEEMKLEQKKGTSIDVFLSSTKLPDGKLIAFCEDISERKKAEEALKQLNEVLERVGEGIGAGLAVIGKDYRIVWANNRLRNLGIPLNKKCYQTFNKLETVCPDCGVKKIFEQNIPLDIHEFKTVNSKGEETWIELRVTPLKDKNGTTMAALELAVPITERKIAEQTLIESEAHYHLLADNTRDVIWTMNLDGNFTYVSPSVFQLRGYTSEEVMKQSMFEALTPKSAGLVIEDIQRSLNTGIISSNYYELEQPCKDGSTVWTEVNFTVLRDTRGNPSSILGVSRDINERKKTEQKLRENQVKIEAMNEKLLVVGGLTRHDVGNKLMAARSNLYLLKKRVGINSELEQYFDGVESAFSSVDRIFEFSRLYEKIGSEKSSKENVFECFNQAVALFPDSYKVKIINECQGLEVVADSLLRQLFYNLIDNSLKHGKKITKISLKYSKESDFGKLSYEDDGVGIPEANKVRLFDSGFTTGKGTGLGLHLVKKMMDVYGWTITEEGEPGVGAKFVIAIPKTIDTIEICNI